MDGVYDLWDTQSGNMIGTFDSESEALSVVRDLIADFGNEFADELDLGWIAPDGRSRSTASGAALLERAYATVPAHASEPQDEGIA